MKFRAVWAVLPNIYLQPPNVHHTVAVCSTLVHSASLLVLQSHNTVHVGRETLNLIPTDQ